MIKTTSKASRWAIAVFAAIVVVALAFFFSGCAAQAPEQTNSSSQESEADIDSSKKQEDQSLGEEPDDATIESGDTTNTQISLSVNGTTMTATLADNSSAEALVELLEKGSLTIEMSDYGGMEKVGSIGQDLPTNNEQITTEAGDLILFMGNSFVIYYEPNSWNFTRLGTINNVSQGDLKEILGIGDVAVTLSLN